MSSGEAVMRTEARVPFRGWRIVTFTTYDSVRERVNGVSGAGDHGLCHPAGGLLHAVAQARSQMALFQRESAELRLLNARLQREIAERERMQEGPCRGRTDAGAIVQAGGAGRDVGGGQP
jgi:two-component system, NtrC family, C4-dicarboxylate transport sensor histidine kinase DctB